MHVIVTDLTCFQAGTDTVCLGGVDERGEVYRPQPYVKIGDCDRWKLRPGSIVELEFPRRRGSAPHVEDTKVSRVIPRGIGTQARFRRALEQTLRGSLSDGFGVDVEDGEKCVPLAVKPIRSLITIVPKNFYLLTDYMREGKLRADFADATGCRWRQVSVTDRCLLMYLEDSGWTERAVVQAARFLRQQEVLFLRVGLSREYKSTDGRRGYWIQINGIYTFPQQLNYLAWPNG
ncbi:MAG: hypothetical protein KatS3mg111_2923 [Pirellulaceae bacterium]|nr:MAG: hypothetical protein KatS3mg111_2923 [Pirellulaceae bacterium]